MAEPEITDADIALLRSRMCGTKVRHDTMLDARTVARYARAQGDTREPYWCRFCGWHHTGHGMAWQTIELFARAIRQDRLPPPERRMADVPVVPTRPIRDPAPDRLVHHRHAPRWWEPRRRRGRRQQSS